MYVTPKSYLSFLAGFRDLYERKLAHVRGLAASIAAGLAKMKGAKVDVGRMQASAAKLQKLSWPYVWLQPARDRGTVGSSIITVIKRSRSAAYPPELMPKRTQVELGVKNVELAAASEQAEALLKDISASTAVAEKEKARVAVIVEAVTKKAAVRPSARTQLHNCCCVTVWRSPVMIISALDDTIARLAVSGSVCRRACSACIAAFHTL